VTTSELSLCEQHEEIQVSKGSINIAKYSPYQSRRALIPYQKWNVHARKNVAEINTACNTNTHVPFVSSGEAPEVESAALLLDEVLLLVLVAAEELEELEELDAD